MWSRKSTLDAVKPVVELSPKPKETPYARALREANRRREARGMKAMTAAQIDEHIALHAHFERVAHTGAALGAGLGAAGAYVFVRAIDKHRAAKGMEPLTAGEKARFIATYATAGAAGLMAGLSMDELDAVKAELGGSALASPARRALKGLGITAGVAGLALSGTNLVANTAFLPWDSKSTKFGVDIARAEAHERRARSNTNARSARLHLERAAELRGFLSEL